MKLLTVGLLSVVLCASAAVLAEEPAPAPPPAAPPAAAPADAKPPATQPAGAADLKTLKDKVSYAIGLSIGGDFKTRLIEVDPAMFMRGLKDAMAGAEPLLTEEQINDVLTAYRTELSAKQMAKIKAQGEKNLKEGQAFLEKNKTAEGVKTTPSGLQYKVLVEGKGEPPKATDLVTVQYRGTLLDGTEFDSTYKRNSGPWTTAANDVIPGWTEGLQLMRPGGKYRLFIPASLAYRESERGPGGPNSVLIFDIELLSVKPAPPPAPAMPDAPADPSQMPLMPR